MIQPNYPYMTQSITQVILPLAPATLDCRAETAFQQGHAADAISIPVQELFARMHELPMRSVPLVLYADQDTITPAQEFLISKGYSLLQTILWTSVVAEHLQTQHQFATGHASCVLWQAAPLIQRFVQEFMPQYGIQAGKGLDIGCGAGRDLVYLAKHGWEMTGIDHLAGALKRTQELAAHNNVSVTTLERDLELDGNPLVEFAPQSFDLIYGVRYLHRPLFPLLKPLLKPKGIFLYQTFMQGCEVLGGPRNPKFLLKQGELGSLFSEATLLLNQVDTLEDGRPISAFIALMPDLKPPHIASLE